MLLTMEPSGRLLLSPSRGAASRKKADTSRTSGPEQSNRPPLACLKSEQSPQKGVGSQNLLLFVFCFFLSLDCL